ncbi:hypothetical protein H6F44_20800 [Pseudanabaena sp. FACHB-1277]|uniref:Uncharacterized protein n=1 Tax=Pseudanabaena cinerea FACHB-1277 TaxID=2949581 RepID=A0A926Z8B4_9CYAN|nr:hypothetical protein [Pseudanabaena cinerea]MBD2152538.1 hypothetical protein [Pseudanabaena cinerea FACHB-1277]
MTPKTIISACLISLFLLTGVEAAFAGKKHRSAAFQTGKAVLKRNSINDPKTPRHIRGWLKNEQRTRGDNARKWRNPKGYDVGHDSQGNLRWENSNMNRSRGGKFKK